MKTFKIPICLLFVLSVQILAGCKDKIPTSTLENGLVAFYTFDNNILDQSGSGNDGSAFGGGYMLKSADNWAYRFNGVADYIKINNNASLNPGDGVTVSAWFKPVAFNGKGWVPLVVKPFTSNTYPYYQYFLGIGSDASGGLTNHGYLGFTINISNEPVTALSTSLWQAGEWIHIVGLYDGYKVKIYVNGLLEYTFTVGGGSISIYNSDLFLAKKGQDGVTTPGDMDNVRIYNRGLTGPEVWELYQKEFSEIAK
jgi:hypothetical protein